MKANDTASVRDVQISAAKNGTTIAATIAEFSIVGDTTQDYQQVSFSAIVDLVANDYIQGFVTDGSALNHLVFKYGNLSVVGLNGKW